MSPLPMSKALDFWVHVNAGVSRGERALLVAEDAGERRDGGEGSGQGLLLGEQVLCVAEIGQTQE